MKSYITSYSVTQLQKEIDKVSMKTLREYKDELYDKVNWDCFQQALAVCFTALELMGWRKKRLTRFKDAVEEVTHMMYCGVMGREYTTRDALQRLKDVYGIDLEESHYKEEYDRDAAEKDASKKGKKNE